MRGKRCRCATRNSAEAAAPATGKYHDIRSSPWTRTDEAPDQPANMLAETGFRTPALGGRPCAREPLPNCNFSEPPHLEAFIRSSRHQGQSSPVSEPPHLEACRGEDVRSPLTVFSPNLQIWRHPTRHTMSRMAPSPKPHILLGIPQPPGVGGKPVVVSEPPSGGMLLLRPQRDNPCFEVAFCPFRTTTGASRASSRHSTWRGCGTR